MKDRALISSLLLFLSCAMPGAAQDVLRPAASLQLTANDARGAVVPAGSTSTLSAFIVEADTTGKNFFDVATSDPSVVVSLILPSGTEVTSANAASLGFGFNVAANGAFANSEIETK